MITTNDLAPLPRWVGWRNERRNEDITKVPYDPASGRRAEANDPSTWSTRERAEVWAQRNVNGQGGGIGLQLGDLGNGRAIGGVDLDRCRDPDGTFTSWALDVLRELDSYTEISPSGTGAKVYFQYDAAALGNLRDRDLIGKGKFGRQFKQAAGKHAPGLELHLSNRYFAVTGQRLPPRREGCIPASERQVADRGRRIIRARQGRGRGAEGVHHPTDRTIPPELRPQGGDRASPVRIHRNHEQARLSAG